MYEKVERASVSEFLAGGGEQEARFLNLADHAPVMMWVTDAHGQCTYLNKRWYEFTGQSEAEGMGLGWTKATHPDDQKKAAETFAAANAARAPYRVEYRLRRADGQYRWTIDAANPRFEISGEFLGYVGSVIDIDQRRDAEERLRDSEEHYRHAAELNPQVAWTATPDGQLDRVAERWREWTGTTGLGDTWGRGLHPDDLDHTTEAWVRSVTTGAVYDVEHRVKLVSGGYRWARSRAYARRDPRGAIVKWYGATEDIHEQKLAEERMRESEARFQAIADSIDQMVWSTRSDGFHDYYNQRWYEYTGVPSGSTDGEGWNEMFHPEDQERAWSLWRHSLATGEPYRIEYRLRHRSGQYRWVLGRAQAVRGEDGQIIRWYGTCTDIQDIVDARDILARSRGELERLIDERTEMLMRTEEQLRQAQKMEAVGQLTGGIAHDFNNLLAGIVGSLDLMQTRLGQGRTENLERYASAAMGSAQRAAALTHRLLAFSRRQPLDPKAIDANALIASMEDLLRRTIGPSHELRTSRATNLWTTLCDPNQLESAMLNLAINARDAMPDGGSLTIETSNVEIEQSEAQGDVRPGQYVAIQITDIGTGMPDDVIERAFEPFFTTKPLGQGTGLGLSMVYGFAKQSEGHISIDSMEGRGTTVTIFLPRYRGLKDEDDVVDPALQSALAEIGETIVVVEDEQVVRDLIVEVLQDLGYHANAASDGPSGLRLLQTIGRVDLLITDVGLPGLNGRQLADLARAKRPDLKVLFITGYADSTTAAAGFLGPGMEMVTKPFAVDALINKITALLRTE